MTGTNVVWYEGCDREGEGEDMNEWGSEDIARVVEQQAASARRSRRIGVDLARVGDDRTVIVRPCYGVIEVSWPRRLRLKLFPRPARPFAWDDTRTFITVELHTSLNWKDRLRALVSGRLRTTALVYTDVEVHVADTRAVTWIE